MDPLTDPTRPLRIAIVRLTSLGDVVHGLPVAAAIRRHRPNARIVWLVEEREQVLLNDNPVVDEVIVVPLRRWRRRLASVTGLRDSARELRDLSRRLRAARLDVAIDLQGWTHKSTPATLLTRAPVRIGFDRRHARDRFSPLATNRHVTPPPEARHIVDQNLCLLGPLGIPPTGPAEFPLPAFTEAEGHADAWRRAHHIEPGHRIVVLLPSTPRPAKRWPAESFREIARRLLADRDARVIVLGGPGEEARLEDVRDGLPADRAFTLAPRPIPDLVAILRHAQLAIGNDTGPLHIAAVSGVPSIGLFGPTNGARNGPYGAHCGYLQSPTGRMADVGVDEVVEAARQLAGGARHV